MLSDITALEMTLWFCAILGSGLFIINTLLNLSSGIDTGVDLNSHATSHEGLSSPDSAFQLLSMTSLTGFIMMFGWIGLAAHNQFHLNALVTLLCALVAGIATMYATAHLFQMAKKLVSPGAVFSIEQAIGKKGTVYARIPENGRGQIQIVIGDVTREIDASSFDNCTIESNTSIEVVSAVDQSTLIVKPIK